MTMRAPAASAIGAMHHRASTRAASTSSTRGGKPTRCSSATSTSRTASWVDRSARRARTTRRKTIVRDGAEFANDSGGYERYLSSDAAEGGEGNGEDGAAARAKEGAQMSTSSAQAREREREVGASYDDEFVALVRARKEATEEETRKRWNEGAATPRVAYDLGQDYIRRVSVAYPYAVVGSARGDVAVCDVVDASALAVSPAAHKKDWSDVDARPLGERVLLGAHDGGAVTAVAITKDAPKQEKHDFAHVASGGRDGVVRLYKACKNSAALHELGCANHDDVVTGVTFARGSLWSVALDGRLCRWSLATSHAKGKSAKHAKESLIDADEYVREQAPALTKEGEWRSGQPTLCLNACESSGLISIGNADGSAALLSAEVSHTTFGETAVVNAWIAHEGSTVRAIAHGPNGNTVVTGGGDGVIRVWYLVEEQTVGGFRSMNRQKLGLPQVTPILVAELRGHTSAVVSLSTGCPGRLVSGAHDGTIRVWDLDVKPPPKVANIKAVRRDARYAVLGHTIWLGGTYADAERIICDGANNVLLEYDFSNAPQDV